MRQAHTHFLHSSLLPHRLDHLSRDTDLLPSVVAVHLYVREKPTLVQRKRSILHPKVGRTRNFSKRALNYYMRRGAAVRIRYRLDPSDRIDHFCTTTLRNDQRHNSSETGTDHQSDEGLTPSTGRHRSHHPIPLAAFYESCCLRLIGVVRCRVSTGL